MDSWNFDVLLIIRSSSALGIGAASFASGASKDIAESPTASPERPKERTSEIQKLKTSEGLWLLSFF